jgi:hypothetical protein
MKARCCGIIFSTTSYKPAGFWSELDWAVFHQLMVFLDRYKFVFVARELLGRWFFRLAFSDVFLDVGRDARGFSCSRSGKNVGYRFWLVIWGGIKLAGGHAERLNLWTLVGKKFLLLFFPDDVLDKHCAAIEAFGEVFGGNVVFCM